MTITWITGNSKSGKTTLANKMISGEVLLDGDDMRTVWTDLKFTKDDRWEQNMRIARLAKILDKQGFNVIVCTICPFRELRKQVQELTGCKFITLEGGIERDFPYEY